MNYYSYKLEDVLEMESADYNTLTRLMLMNEARDKLSAFEANVYSKLKDDKRKEVFKRYYKIAYPQNFEVKNVVKLSDLNRVLK